jgi:hypothetical protein
VQKLHLFLQNRLTNRALFFLQKIYDFETKSLSQKQPAGRNINFIRLREFFSDKSAEYLTFCTLRLELVLSRSFSPQDDITKIRYRVSGPVLRAST